MTVENNPKGSTTIPIRAPDYTFPAPKPNGSGDSDAVFVDYVVHKTYRVDADTVAEAITKILTDENGAGIDVLSEHISCDAVDKTDWEAYDAQEEDGAIDD